MSSAAKLKAQLCSKTGSVLFMLVLTSGFFLVEITVGYAANSMALVTDSFHKLSDVVSLVVGFFALRYSKRTQRTERNTFGWKRAEVLGAVINAVFLIAICFSILVESFKRIVDAEEIHIVNIVLVVGSVGLFINLFGLAVFYRHGHDQIHVRPHGWGKKKSRDEDGSKVLLGERRELEDVTDRQCSMRTSGACKESMEKEPCIEKLSNPKNDKNVDRKLSSSSSSSGKSTTSGAQLNMRAVYLHMLGDALGSIIIITSGLIIKYTSGSWNLYVDPVMSILMVALILRTSIPLLRDSSMVLLQTVPTHIKLKGIQDRLLRHIKGVISMHDFHVWQLDGDKIIASAHMLFQSPEEYMAIANQIQHFFHNEGIHSTTIQPEFVEQDHEDQGCTMPCDKGRENSCAAQQCCTEALTDAYKRVEVIVDDMSADSDGEPEANTGERLLTEKADG